MTGRMRCSMLALTLDGNESLEYVGSIAATENESSDFIRNACAEYRTIANYGYGNVGVDTKRIVA